MTDQTTPVTSWTVLDQAHRALRDAAAAVPVGRLGPPDALRAVDRRAGAAARRG